MLSFTTECRETFGVKFAELSVTNAIKDVERGTCGVMQNEIRFESKNFVFFRSFFFNITRKTDCNNDKMFRMNCIFCFLS